MSELFIICEDCNEFVSAANLRHAKHKKRDLVPDVVCGVCEKKIIFGEPKTITSEKEAYHNRCMASSPVILCGYCHKPILQEMLQWKNRVAYDEACYGKLFSCKECGEETDPLEDMYDASGNAHHSPCLVEAAEAVSPKNLKEVCSFWLKLCVKFAKEEEAERTLKFRAYKAEQKTLAEIKEMKGNLGYPVVLPKEEK